MAKETPMFFFFRLVFSMSENALHLHPKGRAMVSRRAVWPACPVMGYSVAENFTSFQVKPPHATFVPAAAFRSPSAFA